MDRRKSGPRSLPRLQPFFCEEASSFGGAFFFGAENSAGNFRAGGLQNSDLEFIIPGRGQNPEGSEMKVEISAEVFCRETPEAFLGWPVYEVRTALGTRLGRVFLCQRVLVRNRKEK